MTTVLFIHGTGVREDDYNSSFKDIEKGLTGLVNLKVEQCYWGDKGAKLNLKGLSIPEYNSNRGVDDLSEDDLELVLWSQLYKDPFYELRLLSLQTNPKDEFIPGQQSVGEQFDERVQNLSLTTELQTKLIESDLEPQRFVAIRQIVTNSEPYQTLINNITEETSAHRIAVARAMLARMVTRSDPDGNDVIIVPLHLKNKIIQLLVEQLGGFDMAISDRILSPLKGAAAGAATWWARRRRTDIMDYAYPFAGDILCYQGRHGEEIRDFITRKIKESSPPVVVLAHSLGGIMSADVLVKNNFSGHVKQFITVGSQVPLVYEIDALYSLPYNKKLPDYFPPWLNIYDMRDLLSFAGEKVFFPGKIQDVLVNNGEPFKESHSAYWKNPEVWEAIIGVL